MYYTASNIVQRALRFADLTNTDFLTYTELVDYLNDAFISLYQSIIQHGDTVFCNTLSIGTGGGQVEIPLPEDFYQMHSLRDAYTGQLFVRASTSQGDYSGTYRILNNKLQLNGIMANQLELIYYPVPTFVSIPDNTLTIPLESKILSTCKNMVLLETGAIYDVITAEQIGAITIDGGRNYALGDGFVCIQDSRFIIYTSLNGTALNTYTIENATLLNNGYYQVGNTIYFKGIAQFTLEEDDTTKYYITADGQAIEYKGTLFRQVVDFNGKPAFISITNDTATLLIAQDEEYTEFEEIDLNLSTYAMLAIVDYGVIGTNGTNILLYSGIPDTQFDFPQNIYYQMLAVMMAMAFVAKQNASNEGLTLQYATLQKTYRNSLGQNSGPVRIANVY